MLKPKSRSTGLSATKSTPRPGDFPLGSIESRAAARAMIQQRTTLSLYDADCLCLLGFASQYLNGDSDPDRKWMEQTEMYRRGMEVRDKIYGPFKPTQIDPPRQRNSFASQLFKLLHQRFPQPGEILWYEEHAQSLCPEVTKKDFEELTNAWVRRVPVSIRRRPLSGSPKGWKLATR